MKNLLVVYRDLPLFGPWYASRLRLSTHIFACRRCWQHFFNGELAFTKIDR